MLILAGMGRAALSGAISGLGYGVTILNPSLGILRTAAVNSVSGGLSGVVASDPNSKMSGVEAAVLGGVLGNIPLPNLPKTVERFSETVISIWLFLDILLNHIK